MSHEVSARILKRIFLTVLNNHLDSSSRVTSKNIQKQDTQAVPLRAGSQENPNCK